MRRVTGLGVRVEALGVAGAPAPQRLTTTYRLAEGLLLDTGAATHGLSVNERRKVTTILLSHAHLDHTLGLPFLLAETEPQVIGLSHTLDAVRGSLLDDRIWPDLSDRAQWTPIEQGESLSLGAWSVESGPASHTIPCLSYLFRGERGSIAVIGDTRRDPDVLDWVSAVRPTACVVEVSFPDRLATLARRFGHQVPEDLAAWRAALGPTCPIYVSHLKPAHESAVRAECEALGDPHLHILSDGDVIE